MLKRFVFALALLLPAAGSANSPLQIDPMPICLPCPVKQPPPVAMPAAELPAGIR